MSMVLPNKGKISALSFAHLLNDWYMNYIQTLLPFLVMAGLGVSKGAFLVSAFTITSSILQPVFGYLVDQRNQRWMVYVGTLWMAVLISFIGVIDYYPLMVVIAALAGLGTAAFHPQASAMVSGVSGNRKGFFQACFTAAGNIGWALTPLMVVPFVQRYGLDLTPVYILPGVVVALLLWFFAPRGLSKAKIAPPLFYLFITTSGLLSYVWLALAGAALLASFSVTVVVAQEIISKNAAMASGLMLGFGVGIGGLGVGLFGIIAEQMGIAYTIHILIWLPLFAGVFALLLKKDTKT
ncbi:MAG: major facilitator superfamily 1 [Firmicutes bacterium]|nr:major facilitator superfamily 1 [Bacillota bacterium]